MTAPKCYEFNSRENPTAKKTEAFDKYLEVFKVESLKASIGEHLQDIASSISAKQMEKFENLNKP